MLAASRFLLSALLLIAALALQPAASGGADPAFTDVPTTDPAYTAINALAQRGIIKGCDAVAGKFCPDDPTLRAQMAALIARANGWDAEDHGNQFADRCDPAQGCIDDDLWRNVGTLQFYGVAKGFDPTNYGPHNAVLQQQVILFISRALIERGTWQRQPDNASIYPNLPRDTAAAATRRRRHRDLRRLCRGRAGHASARQPGGVTPSPAPAPGSPAPSGRPWRSTRSDHRQRRALPRPPRRCRERHRPR